MSKRHPFDTRSWTYEEDRACHYCYRTGERAIFVDRAGEIIGEFPSWKEAFDFALNNLHMIDRTEKKQKKAA